MSSVAQVNQKSTIAVRIPQDARDWLEKEAKSTYRTMSGQILYMIEQAKHRQEHTE